MDLLKSNFLPPQETDVLEPDPRAEFRARALENIAGSMVFLDDALLYWEPRDE